jgi:hypothetical protein
VSFAAVGAGGLGEDSGGGFALSTGLLPSSSLMMRRMEARISF